MAIKVARHAVSRVSEYFSRAARTAASACAACWNSSMDRRRSGRSDRRMFCIKRSARFRAAGPWGPGGVGAPDVLYQAFRQLQRRGPMGAGARDEKVAPCDKIQEAFDIAAEVRAPRSEERRV